MENVQPRTSARLKHKQSLVPVKEKKVKKTASESCRQYRQRVKDDPVAYAAFRKNERIRIRNFMLHLTPEKRAIYNAKAAARVKRHRDKKIAEGTLRKPPRPTSPAAIARQRQRWREEKKRCYSQETAEQKEHRNARRREMYALKNPPNANRMRIDTLYESPSTELKDEPFPWISPKFLHSNSTSHTWPFSAVAELIDNAYDPDVAANELHIDKCVVRGKVCLIFQDDGSGLDFDRLLKMLSFGYCEKDRFQDAIGHYGNGFKSGSMRLARDAIVLTVCRTSASVGFLSQTYLEAVGSDCVLVPIIEYRLPNLERIKSQESRNNLEAILKFSPFHTELDLQEVLRSLVRNRTGTGTKIILYNLKRLKSGKLELDFESERDDIRNPESHAVDLTSVYHRTSQVDSSEYLSSLRVYCGLLFLRPRMKIYIRGKKVKTQLISKSLSQTEIDVYKPSWLKKPLRITFGFSTQTPLKEDYGVMFYHRNRLIKAYEKLGFQKQPNDLGMGVVGVVQVDCLKPIHNKQDFEKDEKYNAIMSSIGVKLNDYWNEKKNGQSGVVTPVTGELPDWLWAQCERCLKWRRLPDSVRSLKLPDQWFCRMNLDPTHNRCDIPEEPEDEDEAVLRPTYEKTYKKKQEEKKRQKQTDIAAKEAELRAREAALVAAQRKQQLNEVTSSMQSDRDIAQLQKALQDAKRREETHKRLIVQIQSQKQQVARQQSSLLQAASSLHSAPAPAPTELLEAASTVTGDNPVSSTCQRRGRKRQSSGGGDGGGRKVMNLTTETGDTVTIERAVSDDEDNDGDVMPAAQDGEEPAAKETPAPTPTNNTAATPAPPPGKSPPQAVPLSASTPRSSTRPRRQHRPAAVATVIDLTIDDLDEVGTSSEAVSQKRDVKPDKAELDRRMAGGEGMDTNTPTASNDLEPSNSSCPGKSGDLDPSVKVKVEDDSRLGQLRQKYKLLQKRFSALQHNVHRLLSFIVPDIDLGAEDEIEHIVTEMIRVNCNSQADSQEDNHADNQTDSQADSHADNQEDNHADNQTDSQADNQTDSQADNQADNQTSNQAGNQTTSQTNNRTDNQTDSQTDNQADNQTASQTNNQADNQTASQTNDQADNQTNNQADNQTASQTDNQTNNRTDNQTATQTNNRTNNQTTSQTNNRTDNPAVSQTNNRTDNQPASQTNNRTDNQAASQTNNRTDNQTTSQTDNQTASQTNNRIDNQIKSETNKDE